jgi:ABC-type phosphate/phosphonate transport system substrate-binding protein
MRVASLGMYDLPALREANDALWGGMAAWLRAKGVQDVPEQLDHERSLAQIWDDPHLLLAQTCGFPFATRWRDRLRYIATPVYDVPACERAWYRSVLVVAHHSRVENLSDLRGATVAINEPSSNSGCNLLAAAVAPIRQQEPFFGRAILTGLHHASAVAVADGRAAIAAIDAITYTQLSRYHPDLTAGLRTIGWTALAPGLPLVTSIMTPPRQVALLGQALAWASQTSELREARNVLLLKSFASVQMADYISLATLTDADGESVPDTLAAFSDPG